MRLGQGFIIIHCGLCGPDDSLLRAAVLNIVGCLAVSLASHIKRLGSDRTVSRYCICLLRGKVAAG